jgi:hypothetical protein
MTEISPETRFETVGGVEINNVPDGAMVYQKDRERVHFLNPTALIIYELCGLKKSTQEIEGFLAGAFGLAEPPTAAVRDCLVSLVEEGLVVCAPSSAAP